MLTHPWNTSLLHGSRRASTALLQPLQHYSSPLNSSRCASFSLPLTFKDLQDFIYYAYTFYTGLFEEPTLRTLRSGFWRSPSCSSTTRSYGPSIILSRA
ncbi:hypothetical protein M405DRAFT_118256 [Rhizopogon salebrosus TDB-379]|nr:hypothetical protein M405DRAFT_118256 [Rhizopogon salebrosus TDB-379]